MFPLLVGYIRKEGVGNLFDQIEQVFERGALVLSKSGNCKYGSFVEIVLEIVKWSMECR